ncbi:MAG: hypothetical protein QM703_28780 [Gemmatales bacterium]
MKRTIGLFAALLALVWATSAARAEEVHKGKVVSVSNGKLTMTDMNGKNEHSHMVPSDATITCDGATCKLDDLTKDCWVKVTREKKATPWLLPRWMLPRPRSLNFR